MDNRVRDFIRTETKSILRIERAGDFEEVYSVFLRILDVETPSIPGSEYIGSRVRYALEKIALEKLDRDDIITIVSGKFEAFCGKALYLVDQGKGLHTREDGGQEDHSLTAVLYDLGISAFVKNPKNRTAVSQAVHFAYSMRDLTSADMEDWAMAKCFYRLSQCLAAYLIVVGKNLSAIKSALGIENVEKVEAAILEESEAEAEEAGTQELSADLSETGLEFVTESETRTEIEAESEEEAESELERTEAPESEEAGVEPGETEVAPEEVFQETEAVSEEASQETEVTPEEAD